MVCRVADQNGLLSLITTLVFFPGEFLSTAFHQFRRQISAHWTWTWRVNLSALRRWAETNFSFRRFLLLATSLFWPTASSAERETDKAARPLWNRKLVERSSHMFMFGVRGKRQVGRLLFSVFCVSVKWKLARTLSSGFVHEEDTWTTNSLRLSWVASASLRLFLGLSSENGCW